MGQATVDAGKIATPPPAADSDNNDPLARAEAILPSICEMAFRDGKDGGYFTVGRHSLAARLRIPQSTLDDLIARGVALGWLREKDGQLRLAAAGIYIAKLTLGLPT